MTMTTVQQILSDANLVPWIEENAFKYSMHRFVMPSRVLIKTDMKGWNSRKVSNVLRPLGARLLQEGVDIPASKMHRKRLAEISPSEWGDRYPVTNRRIDTDPEDVLADVVSALGYSLGRKREQQLFQTAISNAVHSITATGAYTIDQAVQMQTLYEAKAFDGQLYHVIHPYQELDVKQALLSLSNSAVPEFRNQFIRQWSYGGFGGLNIAVSSMVPRKVTFRVKFDGVPVADEEFKLRFNLLDTANIKVGANAAGTLTNILAALNGLSGFGGTGTTWTGSGTTYSTLVIVSPVYVDEECQLEMGLDADGDVVNEVTGGITIEEVSAKARAPFFQSEGIIYDIRSQVAAYTEWIPKARTLDIGAYEVYGVGAWNAERLGYIETDASSPMAVPA